MYICIYIYVYVNMYICKYVYVYIYIYMYEHKSRTIRDSSNLSFKNMVLNGKSPAILWG